MLKNLIRFSIDHAGFVVLTALLVLVLAALRLGRMPVDVFPELNAPTVVVMTEAPGLAADEVEQFVTFPLEVAVQGVPGVRRVRTTSAIGMSIAYVEFEWGADVYRSRQLVSERLDTVREDLPEGAHVEMTPITSVTGEIMLLAVSSPDGTKSQMELRSFAEFDLRNKLLGVPGIAQVSVIGGELPEYQVIVEPERLLAHDLTLDEIARALDEAHSTLSAGYLLDVDHLEIPVRQGGRVRGVEDIERTLVRLEDGAPLTLGDVAQVRLGATPARGTGADAGRPAVIMTVQKSPATNTLEITRAIDRLLDSLEPTWPEGVRVNRQIFRQADFIERSVNNVLTALLEAALIVTLILALFLLNARTTIVALSALPLSLAAGLLALEALGETLNVMTLGVLAIAVGSLVDDAIIDVENVFRRLRENAARPPQERATKRDVVFQASNEIRPAMVFATLIIALVFLPLMFLGGVEGRFFRPLGIAFVVSLVASLLVALTVTPALCQWLLKDGGSTRDEEGRLVRWLRRLYEPVVLWALRARRTLFAACLLATGVAVFVASGFGTAFLPEFNEGTWMVGLFAPPGTSLEASDRMASAVERQLLELEGVASVTRRTGRAERDEHAEPVSSSEIDVTIQAGYSRDDVRRRIREVLDRIPGINSNIGQPIEHRLSHVLSGTPAALAISVFGEDLDRLRTIAKELERELEALPGARDVTANREVRIQSLPIEFDHERLAAVGLTPESAARQVRQAIHGIEVGDVHDGPRRLGLAVRLVREARRTPADVEELLLTGAEGAQVRLRDVAEVGLELASNLIARENSQRKAVVSLNVAPGANLGHLVEEARARVDPIVARHGYTAHYGGQFEAQRSATRSILLVGGVVLVLAMMLLQLAIGSLRVAALVLVNLPLALIGGVLAVFIAGLRRPLHDLTAFFSGGSFDAPVLTIASLVGFITLFGIAVRNGILLVNHYRHLVDVEGAPLREAIVRGSSERLVPILMTALTAALALVPIALQRDEPGNEILAPLSIVILGGLLTSTFLNLVVVPAGYAALFGVRAQLDGESSPT